MIKEIYGKLGEVYTTLKDLLAEVKDFNKNFKALAKEKAERKHFKGQWAMVRTQSAGVFMGFVEEDYGDVIWLSQGRRIWYWEGSASLSQLATDGTTLPTKCKFPVQVDAVELLQVIEVIAVTPKARASIESVPVWESK